MADESWDRVVEPVAEDELGAALARVRARAAERRSERARRWRLIGIAATLAATFSAGLLAGRATAPSPGATRMWAVGGASMAANRASFVSVAERSLP